MGIPTKDADLRDYAVNVDTLIAAAPARYGQTAVDSAAIHAAVEDYVTKLTAASDPQTRNKVAVAEKNLAKANLVQLLRLYLAQIKANKGVAEGDKVALGIVVGEVIRTPKPAPTTPPQLQVSVQGSMTHALRYADVTTPNKRTKPFGAIGLQLFVTTATTTPPGPSAARFYAFVNGQNFAVEFDEADVGKTAYYFGRWQDGRGRVGPWSVLTGVVVA